MNRLEQIRILRGISIEDVIKRAHDYGLVLGIATYRFLEASNHPLSGDSLRLLSRVFDVSEGWLSGEEGCESKYDKPTKGSHR